MIYVFAQIIKGLLSDHLLNQGWNVFFGAEQVLCVLVNEKGRAQ